MKKRAASEVKARWRDIVADVKEHGEVMVTNHARPEVVVVSIDQYAKLKRTADANDPLASLRADFDRELAALRHRDAPAKIREFFQSTPQKLGSAAKRAATRRRR